MASDHGEQRERVIELLTKAYWMEIETVMSYIANSIEPGRRPRAGDHASRCEADIQEELGHAQQFAARIKELYGVVPGSAEFTAEQSYLQPPDEQVDIVHVIKGVIEAEPGAIEHYSRIIEETDGIDPVTQDMVIAILRDEQGHKRLFEGFLREYEQKGWPRRSRARRSTPASSARSARRRAAGRAPPRPRGPRSSSARAPSARPRSRRAPRGSRPRPTG